MSNAPRPAQSNDSDDLISYKPCANHPRRLIADNEKCADCAYAAETIAAGLAPGGSF